MAENKENAPAGGKSKLKLIIILTLVVLMAVGLSVAGTYWLLKGDSDSGSDAADSDEPAEEVFVPSRYLTIEKPFIVTLTADGRQRYMQIFVAFQSRDQAALDAAETHMPLIRSRLLSLFGGQDFAAMQTVEGKQQLLADTLAAVNGVLEQEGASPVDRILFENFVLQ
ncbi:MAG: flagellar basal body protein FliL [Alteromonadaceae bacterium]|nr:flagellar basal body protein FliL [Alteromonadaceae bacterium]MBH84212.1 flagellar basal body protein FliL [Alteromonadaceae bacterium]